MQNVKQQLKKHIVADCDEVLVRISPKWVYLMHSPENFEYFNRFFRLNEGFDLKKHASIVLNRPQFYLNKWLLRKDILEKNTIEEINECVDRMMSLYDSSDFYDSLVPTALGKSLALAIKQPRLERLSIVTRVTSENVDSKEKFLKTLFQGSMSKVDIYYIEADEKKSDVISILGDDIAAVYEDEVNNIDDIINNCNNIGQSTIFVPSYGYNVNIPQSTYETAKRKEIIIQPYSESK